MDMKRRRERLDPWVGSGSALDDDDDLDDEYATNDDPPESLIRPGRGTPPIMRPRPPSGKPYTDQHLEILDLTAEEVFGGDRKLADILAAFRASEAEDEAKTLHFEGADDTETAILRRTIRLQERWEQAFGRYLDRLWERRATVLKAKGRSTQFRRGTRLWDPPGDAPLRMDVLIDRAAWDEEVTSDLEPMLRDLWVEATEALEILHTDTKALPGDMVEALRGFVRRWLEPVLQWNETVAEVVEEALTSEATRDLDVEAAVDNHVERVARQAFSRLRVALATGATNQAQREAAEATERVLEKVWYSARDLRVRPGHRLASGQRVPLASPFRIRDRDGDNHEMQYPGDISAPRSLWINCRCVVLYITPETPVVSRADALEDSYGRLRGAEKSWSLKDLGLHINSE